MNTNKKNIDKQIEEIEKKLDVLKKKRKEKMHL